MSSRFGSEDEVTGAGVAWLALGRQISRAPSPSIPTAARARPSATGCADISLAMLAAGGGTACAVHRWLGIGALRAGWLNLEWLWAGSLVAVGALSHRAAW